MKRIPNNKHITKLIKKHYSFLKDFEFVETDNPKINFCNLIAYARNEYSIVFCNDVRDRLLEVSIYKLINGHIVVSDENITRLHEILKDVTFDEAYNYQLYSIETVVKNGAIQLKKHLEAIMPVDDHICR